NYRNITNTDPDLIQIKKSIKILLEDKITYEFRTTVVPGLHKKEDFHDIGELIKGARVWYIQNFRNTANLVNNAFQKEIPFSENELTEIIKICNLYILNSKLR
ncbi:MAG: hypothetical protein NT091_00795, partial [Candidatus Falkowbacteria bacterium]|nr:hypothetical protein [Candidatus Falkowbacteria bacterium]